MNNEMIKLAIDKLSEENKKFKGNRYASAMRTEVLHTLKEFCKQDEEFAQAVVQNGKTFSDCMEKVAKGVGNSISDIEAYRRAVNFYFPGATINFTMKIDLIGAAALEPIEMTSQPEAPKKKSVLELSLDDLF